MRVFCYRLDPEPFTPPASGEGLLELLAGPPGYRSARFPRSTWLLLRLLPLGFRGAGCPGSPAESPSALARAEPRAWAAGLRDPWPGGPGAGLPETGAAGCLRRLLGSVESLS